MNKPAAAAALAGLLCLTALAQSQTEQSDLSLDERVRSQVIENALRNLNDYYVFPEVAKQMEIAVRGKNKEYDAITSAREMAAVLTAHLQEVSHDKHLRVVYWEGVGVKPDIETPAQQALKVAYIDALNKNLAKASEPRSKAQINSAIEAAQKELDDLKKKN